MKLFFEGGIAIRVVITGAGGQLGTDCVPEARRRGWEPIGADIDDFDLTDRAATLAFLENAKPDCVLHCAAYTAVDKAEDEPETARAVNEGGTAAIAEYCAARDIWLCYVSTDYVFDGSGSAPREVDAPTAPQNVYGATKLAGEQAIRAACKKYLIVRTSWVFGNHGSNFVKTMLRLGKTHTSLTVVEDQVGAPTYTPHLARLLCDMLARPVQGVYHAANLGETSWAGFARQIFGLAGLPCKVVPVPSSQYPQKAVRPKNSRLSPRALQQTGYAPLPPLNIALTEMLEKEGELR
ncbi:MAG: dTDP-4-dehydrorhamnose reductase [Oscillospiraceae bacterium]|nr:dTDP-4-dehydrorhamnose reductase [Oscillospiraceae bacterium]